MDKNRLGIHWVSLVVFSVSDVFVCSILIEVEFPCVELDTKLLHDPVVLQYLQSWHVTMALDKEVINKQLWDNFTSMSNMFGAAAAPSREAYQVVGSGAETALVCIQESTSEYDIALQLLSLLKRNACIAGSDTSELPSNMFTSVPGSDQSLLDRLVAAALLHTTTDFITTDTAYQVTDNAICRDTAFALHLHGACPIFQLPLPISEGVQSKVALFLECRRLGWEPVAAILGPHAESSPKKFPYSMLKRSGLYLKFLLSYESVYSKNAKYFLHDMPEAYYKCLLGLPDLEGFHERPDFLMLNSDDFRGILASRDPLKGTAKLLALEDAPPLAVQDDDGALEDAIIDEAEFLQLFALDGAIMPAHSMPREMQPWSITIHDKTVRFDGCSHSSGKQRGYISCSRQRETERHAGCYKYKFLHHHEQSYIKTAAWLIAWDLSAHDCADRGTHYDFKPTPPVLAKIEQKLIAMDPHP